MSGLDLGSGVSLSGIGSFLQVNSRPDGTKFLHLHREFTDQDGSIDSIALNLNPLTVELVLNEDDSVDLFQNEYIITRVPGTDAILFALYFKTHEAATSPITIDLSIGDIPNDFVIHHERHPASEFPANSNVRIEVGSGLDFKEGSIVNARIFSDDGQPIFFKGDAIGNAYIAVDFASYTQEVVIVHPSGTDKFIIKDSDGSILVDEQGNLIIEG